MSYIKHDSTHDYDIIGGVCSTSTPDTELPDGSKDKFAKIVVNIPEITEILGEDMTCTNPVQLAQSSKINIWSLNKPFHWANNGYNNGFVFDFEWNDNSLDTSKGDARNNWFPDDGDVYTYKGFHFSYTDSITNHMKLYSPVMRKVNSNGEVTVEGDPIYLGDWRKYVHCNNHICYKYLEEDRYIETPLEASCGYSGTYSATTIDSRHSLCWYDYSAEKFTNNNINIHGGEEVTDPLGFKYFPEAGLVGCKRLFDLPATGNYIVVWIGSGPSYSGTSSARKTDLTVLIKMGEFNGDYDDIDIEGSVTTNSNNQIINSKKISREVSDTKFGTDEKVNMGIGIYTTGGSGKSGLIPLTSTTAELIFKAEEDAKRCGITTGQIYICYKTGSDGNKYWDVEEFGITYQQRYMAVTDNYTTITLTWGTPGGSSSKYTFKITPNPNTSNDYSQRFSLNDLDGWNEDPALSGTSMRSSNSSGYFWVNCNHPWCAETTGTPSISNINTPTGSGNEGNPKYGSECEISFTDSW